MKINAFDSTFPFLVSLGQTTLDYSTGSNTAEGDLSGGGDVVGTPGAYTVVGLRDSVSLASNIGGGTLGDVLTIVQTSPKIAMFATSSNSGSASPLTTKGDIYTFASADTRLGIGSNGTGLLADSAATTGNRWTYQAIAGELLMQDGVTAPPVPIETESQDDWLYADL